MMKRIKRHVNKWNTWRKYNTNGKLHKFLVLIGLVHSPTFSICLTKEDVDMIGKAINEGIKEGLKNYADNV